MAACLECRDVGKVYGQGDLAETVLTGVSLILEAGQTCVLLGPSGSGKTTLLSILGCLLSPTEGQVLLDGVGVDYRSPRQLIELRRTRIGFVFQQSQLLPFLTVADNLAVVGRNCGIGRRELPDRIGELASQLGLGALLRKKPGQLSSGQRQRVAIARAVLHRPSVLLADEPTSALDWQHGQAAVRLLVEQSRREGTMLFAVTHDVRLVEWFDRVLHIDSGRLWEDKP
jgi:putative ABC transport system ATP-binding protein